MLAHFCFHAADSYPSPIPSPAAATAGAVAVAAPWPSVAGEAALWGDLKGRFVYDGKPPERKRLKVDKDVTCCGKFDIRDESLMVGRDGGLANVFVCLRTRRVAVCPELEKQAANEVLLDNRDCIFQPHCTTIWLGKQEYHIVNSDPIAQSVAFSPPGDAPANIVLAAAPGKNIEARWKFRRRQAGPWRSTATTIRGKRICASVGSSLRRYFGRRREVLHRQAAGRPLGVSGVAREGRTARRAEWPKGRFTATIKPGTNDLGTIKIAPRLLGK